jgi:hypothetical protein
MIYHTAIPANDPQSAAVALARILGGEAMPFPVVPGSWIAWSADGVTELEVVPRGHGFARAEQGKEPRWVGSHGGLFASGWHVAVGTQVDAREVLKIAHEAGWPAQICDRAGFFDIVEVWVDDCGLVEVLDPEMQARYRAAFSPETWRAALAAMARGGPALTSNTVTA